MNNATAKNNLVLTNDHFLKGCVYRSDTSDNMICIVSEPRHGLDYSWCYVCRVIRDSNNKWRVPFPHMATENEIFFNELDNTEHIEFNNELYFSNSIVLHE